MTERGHLRSIQGEGDMFAVTHVSEERFDIELPKGFSPDAVGLVMNALHETVMPVRMTRVQRPSMPIGEVVATEDLRHILMQPDRPKTVLELNIPWANSPEMALLARNSIETVLRGHLSEKQSSYR